MNRYLGGALAACLSALMVVPAAQTQEPTFEAARRELAGVAGPPAVLDGRRQAPVEAFDLDPSEFDFTPPEVWAVDAETGAQYRRGELLVQFESGAAISERAQTLARANVRGSAGAALPWGWERVETDTDAPAAVKALQGVPLVRHAVLNYRTEAFQRRPNDEEFRLQWNFEAIDLPRAWEINPGARQDVVVAVVDTGLNFRSSIVTFFSPYGQFSLPFAGVPDLIEGGRVVSPYDAVYDDDLPFDLGGHGTHVAGTIGQLTDNGIGVAGVAYNVRIMPVKVISGGSFFSWDDIFFPGNRSGASDVIASGIRHAADNGAKVINLSLGGRGPVPLIRDAIRYAVDRGVFVAIAAGNEGSQGNPDIYPAAYGREIDGAMTVGAVNRSLRRAVYSTFKPYVEVCAPGGAMESAIDYAGGITQVGYNEAATLSFLSPPAKLVFLLQGFRPRFDRFELRPLQGTSMATPHVTGIAALLYTQGIRDPRAIEEAIVRFARPIDATADECGAGLVDPRRALRGLGLAR